MLGCVRLNRVAALFLLLILVPIEKNFSADVEYQVQSGDTLYSIARKHGIAHQELMAVNKIQNERVLKVGQILIIPKNGEPSSSLENYEIKGGDTIYSISRRSGMTVQEILDFNNLSSDDIIKPGQVLQVRQTDRPSGQLVQNANDRTASPPASASSPAAISPVVSTTVSKRSRATTNPSSTVLFWPHSGPRFALAGKFPGIVIKGDIGDEIKAVSSGRVVYSGPHSTLANVVFIQNQRGYIYIYGGNRNLLVSSGDEIRSGQVLGALGPSPLLPEVQVYFSVWKEGKYIDPSTSPR